MSIESIVEEIQVLGRDLVDKVRELIHEGNVQRIVVKDEHGNTFVEIPVTVAAIGASLLLCWPLSGQSRRWSPSLQIVVVRSEPKPPSAAAQLRPDTRAARAGSSGSAILVN